MLLRIITYSYNYIINTYCYILLRIITKSLLLIMTYYYIIITHYYKYCFLLLRVITKTLSHIITIFYITHYYIIITYPLLLIITDLLLDYYYMIITYYYVIITSLLQMAKLCDYIFTIIIITLPSWVFLSYHYNLLAGHFASSEGHLCNCHWSAKSPMSASLSLLCIKIF